MGFFARLFGSEQQEPRSRPRANPPSSADATALERYRYMVQTAPPETLEQAHAEAFAQLSPEQRQALLRQLAEAAPANERAAVAATSSEDPRAMARVATRAEIRQPGMMERTLGGPGMGFGGNLLSSFAAGFVGSMVAQSFFSSIGGFGEAGHDAPADDGDTGADANTDVAGDDLGNGDFGDGDFGGGDFGE
jgi:hypothetical protein